MAGDELPGSAAAQVHGYRELPCVAALDAHLACLWTSSGSAADPPDERDSAARRTVLPDGCIDLIWDGSGLFVAGPDTGPVRLPSVAATDFAGARFRPGVAPAFLGLPASEICDQRVELAELWGRSGHELAERLAAGGHGPAIHELEKALLCRLGSASAIDETVSAGVSMLRSRSAPATVAALASELAVSERQLHRRFVAAVGYGPKVFARVTRFRRFLVLANRLPQAGLAELALAAGFADQAHLTRECRRLAGDSPVRLVGRIPTSA